MPTIAAGSCARRSTTRTSASSPLIVQAPRFFSGALKLGDVQQTARAFGEVHDALSFFRNAYDDFAGYRATLNRLTGLLDANTESRELPALAIERGDSGLEIRDLTVIDGEADWSRTLSPGEQQRLGFGRILLSRPSVAFLDEATSALDEGIEHALYTLVRAELPDCILVSVGHRGTLEPLHTNHLELLGDGRWTLTVPVE